MKKATDFEKTQTPVNFEESETRTFSGSRRRFFKLFGDGLAVVLNRKGLPSAGAGEAPIVGIAPAVRNAIAAATGVRLKTLPLVPQGLRETLASP